LDFPLDFPNTLLSYSCELRRAVVEQPFHGFLY
jgi:hypothetical protein